MTCIDSVFIARKHGEGGRWLELPYSDDELNTLIHDELGLESPWDTRISDMDLSGPLGELGIHTITIAMLEEVNILAHICDEADQEDIHAISLAFDQCSPLELANALLQAGDLTTFDLSGYSFWSSDEAKLGNAAVVRYGLPDGAERYVDKASLARGRMGEDVWFDEDAHVYMLDGDMPDGPSREVEELILRYGGHGELADACAAEVDKLDERQLAALRLCIDRIGGNGNIPLATVAGLAADLNDHLIEFGVTESSSLESLGEALIEREGAPENCGDLFDYEGYGHDIVDEYFLDSDMAVLASSAAGIDLEKYSLCDLTEYLNLEGSESLGQLEGQIAMPDSSRDSIDHEPDPTR